LDPLQNKSDQAKLSIRGFVRAARAQAAPDLTTLAVQTRLGDAEPLRPQDPSRPIDPQPANDGVKPDGVRPEPRPLNHPTRNPLDSISDTPPDSSKGKGGDTGLRVDQNQQQPAQDVSRAKTDPSRVDAQAQRSVRTEAAATPVSTRESVQPSRADALQSLIRSGTNARAEGAISSRAVTGVEASGSSRSGIETSVTRGEQAPKPTSSEQNALQAKTIAQVQRGLASLMRSNDSEMTLRLTPERLGELRIQIKRDGDRLALRLSTQNAEARDLLQAGSEELTRALQSKGIQIERVHIEHQPAGENQQGSFDLGQGSHNGHTQGQHQGDQREQRASVESFADEPDAPNQHGIWTELGLDAIA
jgi:flagellar hook-length control protein FliK